jgi:hypothetical protein
MVVGTETNEVTNSKTPNAAVSQAVKRLHYSLDVMLTCMRCYIAYPLSMRHLEEMISERAGWKRHTRDGDDRQERGESRRAKCDKC